MKFIIKQINNWVSHSKDIAVSKTKFPFGFIAVVKYGTNLSFCRGVENV